MPVRQRGLIMLIACGGAVMLFAYWLFNPSAYPFNHHPRGVAGAIIIALPGVGAIIGLIEMACDRPINNLESAWTLLPQWQRRLLGAMMVFLGGTALLVAFGYARL